VAVAVGPFNNDGRLDLAVTNWAGDESSMVSILLEGHFPGVEFSPTGLNFATQLVGSSSNPQPVTLTNIGSVPLKITSIAASTNFAQTNNCPSKLPPNGQCTINVVFKPHKIGSLNGTVTITDNAPTSPQTVPLSGIGTDVTLVPPSLDFGDQKVGTTSPPQDVTFTNHGKRVVSIHGIEITGRDHGQFAETNDCGTGVPAGGSCTISVTFTPKSNRHNPKAATLEVKDNGGGSPQAVALSGTGT
jgi:hypothetical protein